MKRSLIFFSAVFLIFQILTIFIDKAHALSSDPTSTTAVPADQSTDGPVFFHPDPVVVTPTKTEKKLSETTVPITVVTKEEMDKRKDFQVVDALRNVPGLTVVRSGPKGRQTSLFLRGAASKSVLFMVNGVRMNSPANGIPDAIADMPVESVERIEVVRGPQAALYGSDAMAGVINVITKKGTGSPTLSSGFEYGTQNTFKEYSTLSGKTGKVDYFGSFSRIDSDDWMASRRVEHDGYQNTNVNTQLGIELMENLRLDSFYQYLNGFVGVDHGPFDLDRNAWQRSLNNTVGTKLTAKPFEWWEQIFRFSLNSNQYHAEDPAEPETNVPQNFWDSVLPSKVDTKIYDFEAQSNFTLADWNTLTTGVEYEFQTANKRGEAYDWNLFQFTDGSFRNHIRNTSWYIEDQLTFFDRINIVPGVRVIDNNSFGVHADPEVSGSYHHKETDTTFRGNFGTAFKQPTINDLYWLDTGNPNLQPEKSTGYGVGMTQQIPAFNSFVGFDYFHQSYRSLIQSIWDPVTNNFISENTGKAYIDGFEFETGLTNWHGLTSHFFTNLLYTRDKNRGKEELLRRPRWSGGFEVNYHFWERWNVNSNLIYSGDRKDWGREDIQTNPGYVTWALVLSYDITSNLQVYGRTENTTNTHYDEARGYQSPGAAIYVGVKMGLEVLNPKSLFKQPQKK